MKPEEVAESLQLQAAAHRRQSMAPTFDRLIESNLELAQAVRKQVQSVTHLTQAIYISLFVYFCFFVGSCVLLRS